MSGVDAEVARPAEQRMRSAVNFGVASLRRAAGAAPDELLELRCECGSPGCRTSVSISLRDYEAAPLGRALLVLPEHIDRDQGSPRVETDAWAIVESGSGESASTASP